jgi:hypothetical protein
MWGAAGHAAMIRLVWAASDFLPLCFACYSLKARLSGIVPAGPCVNALAPDDAASDARCAERAGTNSFSVQF